METFLKRKAMISDREQKVFAYVEIDRNLGKTKFIYKEEEDTDKEEKLKTRMLENDPNKVSLIVHKLKSHEWYKNSSKIVQKKILNLVKIARTSGFVDDLANRPELMEI